MVYGYIFSIFICQFSHKQAFNSIVLLKIIKKFKVSFFYAILLLNIAIYLRIKGGKQLLFYAQDIA